MTRPVTAILLAAGYATRLYPLTKDTPKPLLPLGKGVILDEIYGALAPGMQKILVTNHRFADRFRAWQRDRGVPLEIVDDGTETVETRLGAIRDLELARIRARAAGDLLVVGTDNLFTWPLEAFIERAQRHAPDPGIAVWELPPEADVSQYGVVRRDPDSRIAEFVEKSPQPPTREVATCIYYFPEAMVGRIREFIGTGGNVDAPGHFIKWLAGRGPVYGLMMSGIWYDIGTLDAYEAVKREWPGAQTAGG